jgi:hypothetical protein
VKRAPRSYTPPSPRVSEPAAAYLTVRKDDFRRLYGLTAIDHSDRSLYEFGEFRPDP